ncbi:microtubule-associated serine/threonine-protein kinase 3-like isoform X2 [Ornithodoros turicata]|uniref:microtubule-associated serine/threonine-protein kinase 3-like isoform X2 n=1 Tax=Ornithodoros turicata TaxID=34597 RepID=UPI003139068F
MSGSDVRSAADKRKASAKMLVAMFPRIPKTATVLLEFFIKRESKVSLNRDPLSHFCQEEVVLHAQECLLKLNKQVISYQDIRDMVENLVGLHTMCIQKNPEVAKALGQTVRKLTIILGEVATCLEKIAEVSVTDWMAVGDALVDKLDKPPFSTFIPRMRDIKSVKMIGAGGFGAVYLANYKPANFIATVKLVAIDSFSKQKQAAMDKVVASVIRNPFLVKYYCSFAVKEAYVTIMEYVAGIDLMRVVTKEQYLEIDAVQVIMAQLILALEHLHLRGFLHRDIKVSNMLILPNGRVKVIDFDTTKVCCGHFSKRVLRGYFRRTSFEFNDGESAGTVPYMAPEILKRRPYGRAVDWWSSGIVMYKLLTGRVPFRGKTKQVLRERIISSPLKWPRVEDFPHSATPSSKDMTYRMLKKNPLERLGSRSYNDLKTHPFFEDFNWKDLYKKKQLCSIPAVKEMLNNEYCASPKSETGKKRHLRIEDMTDVSVESQKPLMCYASPSFRKLMTMVNQSKTQVKVSESFMETSGMLSSGIDYYGSRTSGNASFSISRTAMHSPDSKDSQNQAVEKVDLIVFRKKKFHKFWGFGMSFRAVEGEDGNRYVYVDNVRKDSPADRSQVLPLDVILSVNGTTVSDVPVAQVNKLVNGSEDQLVLSVMSSSSYRLLTTRRDMVSFMKSIVKENLLVCANPVLCGLNRPFGLSLLEANTWDDRGKQFIKVYVLSQADVAPANRRPLFPGDVLTHIDGVAITNTAKKEVMRMLSNNKKDVTLSVVPLSPFRMKRIQISKLHETAISDFNMVTKSTAAEIEPDSD